MEAIGIDVGGVIIARTNNDSDTSFFGDNFLNTPATPGMFEGIAKLVKERFGLQVYLVSKCGQRTQDKTLAWLRHHNFYERTGVSPGHVRFCRKRSDKAAIAEELGLTHFVDDRLEILGYLLGVEHLFLFEPQDQEVERHRQHLHRVHVVHSSDDLVQEILST